GDEVHQELDRLPEELFEVERVEVRGTKLAEVLRRSVERLEHLDWSHAAGERRRQERARRQSDVDVEVGRLPVHQEVVEGLQTAELVRAAGDGAPGQDQRYARVSLARGQVALMDDRQPH